MNIIDFNQAKSKKTDDEFYAKLRQAFGPDAADFFMTYSDEMSLILNDYIKLLESSLSLNKLYKDAMSLIMSKDENNNNFALAISLISKTMEYEDDIDDMINELIEKGKFIKRGED